MAVFVFVILFLQNICLNHRNLSTSRLCLTGLDLLNIFIILTEEIRK